MSTLDLILIISVVVLLLIGIGVLVIVGRRRRAHLKERFGSEYDRTLNHSASRGKAEADLLKREKQHDKLDLRPLSPSARQRYADDWSSLQSRFIDRPQATVADADELLLQLMADRGYPAGKFEAQADVISVDHPELVENYRVAHAVQARTAAGKASTEDLRRAVVSYRALFEELLREGNADAPHEQLVGAASGVH
ncbi:MAG: hypothetical protein WBS54_08125 [Acidobacteriota bacterium]